MNAKIDITKLTTAEFQELQAAIAARAEQLAKEEAERTESEKVQKWVTDLTKGLAELKTVNRETVSEFVVKCLGELNPKKVRRQHANGTTTGYYDPIKITAGSIMYEIHKALSDGKMTVDELKDHLRKNTQYAEKTILANVPRAIRGASHPQESVKGCIPEVVKEGDKYFIPKAAK